MAEGYPCAENRLDAAGRLGARVLGSIGAMDEWRGLGSDVERGAKAIAFVERFSYFGGLFPPEVLQQLREPSYALMACAQNHAAGVCPVFCIRGMERN